MVSQHRQQPSRLFIPPNLNLQQPMSFAENAPLFSPALPTAIQQGMHPQFAFGGQGHPLQTPMQPGFFPPPPGAPGRPSLHRSHPSVMQLAAAGIIPPPGMPMTPLGHQGMPMTPLGQNGFPPQMTPGIAPFAPPFVPRSKRSASMSVGGPPKAVLGGPQRKVSPMPPAAPATPVAPAPAPKQKKVVVNFPRETIPAEGDEPPKRASFARTALSPSEIAEPVEIRHPETSTIELYPPDSWRYHLPSTVDVFLPGKASWDGIKQRIIEEKLQRLGVERGSGSSSTIPQIHAPHARAASISSPADPALLFFKLNKLQQSQNASAANSLSTSPQPPTLSPSPNALPPRLQNRHGHSMSLAQPPSHQSSMFNPAGFNPFGPNAILGSDQVLPRLSPAPGLAPPETIHAPQGRVPTNVASLAPPPSQSRPESRPDFMRGFGVEIPEEEEPEEVPHGQEEVQEDEAVVETAEADMSMASVEETDQEDEQDGLSTVAQSRIHSRHISKLSVALSLRSVGGMVDDDGTIPEHEVVPVRSPTGEMEVEDLDGDGDVDADQEAVGEWTGSEDLRTGPETSDDESIGEWSNPSDEERARTERLHRRMMRRVKQVKQELEIPRRLPNFPRPPSLSMQVPGMGAAADDDIVSNPSDEEHASFVDPYFPRPQSDHSVGRPLPPLPHSRSGSQYSAQTGHDPALAHSRHPSEQYLTPGGLQPRPPQPQSAAPRTDSLNPFAKPFVFGASRQSGTWSVGALSGSPSATPPTHTRAPSLGKPLNAAAQEFKPGNFTFRPPSGVPQLSFPQPQVQVPRPLPTPPLVMPEPARAAQGREKRQRRSLSGSIESDDEDGHNTMTSFKFPPPADETRNVRHSAPASPPATRDAGLNAAAKPFTFSGFSGTLPFMAQHTDNLPQSPELSDDEENDENRPLVSMPVPQIGAEELPFPPASKPRRAPIPLDFTHPVSTNTVPAGLFKALVNNDGEERTRRTVRSRLSSRDIYEHSPRQSLDDLHVPPISQRISRGGRLFTDPGFRDQSPERDDVFSVRRPRRSSLPPRHQDDDEDSLSDMSIAPVNLARRVEMHQYELRLERLLEEKFEGISRALDQYKQAPGSQALNPSTEAMISEVVSLFRAQLQESAAKGLEDSQMDARGELDFEVLKGIIEQSQEETRSTLRREIAGILEVPRERDTEIRQLVEELSNRTINSLASAMSQLGARIQSMETTRAPSVNRDQVVQELLQTLLPHISALRADPVDYDVLTGRLAQAVKPHISQLIDLASDKRETANLIVNQLVPILPSLQPNINLDAVVGRLTSELRSIVGPLDPHEMKEQVSDLVVERLDSRLAVRDRALNVDTMSERVVENVRVLLAPLADMQRKIEELATVQPAQVIAPQLDTASLRQDILGVLSDLPQRLVAATEALGSAQTEFKVRADRVDKDSGSIKALQNVEAAISSVANDHKKLVSQNQEFSEFCNDIIKHINSLPEAMVEATKVLQNAHADFASRDTSQKDSEEIRRLMATTAELQVQLAKARGAHGQVRVEKDMLSERVKVAESERERLHSRVETLQNSVSNKAAEAAALEAKNIELEEALNRALDRIKAADVQAQSQQERLSELEKARHEVMLEKHQFKAKMDALELKVTFATREKEALADELAAQRRQNDELLSQQDRWDELRQATEQIQALANMTSQADQEELKELRRIRDRSKVLEGENTALQRRVKDYETKITNNDKLAQTSRQSLVQARQRAEEWERRAKEAEGRLEVTQTSLDQVEQSHSQLDADYSLVKLQLEERDAEERLDKDRQNKLRDQIASLEGQVARLQAEVDKAKKSPNPTPNVLQPVARYQNGQTHHTPARPDSRASTVYNRSRAVTPKAQYNGTTNDVRVATPPQASVRDSIHAPWRQAAAITPMSKGGLNSNPYFRAPSPTPSTVSVAPTLGDDGWWQ
ncbi:uncharacterized protein TRAVEDRAFT_68801 [Trametes versicolor FP-101664 SS1]|uniref:uncharacterized protein n=1 Tax=Trametes versicolor (strain FP-101664) TaxID=717944 RepID=UPI0004622E9B|nr:uncharacterized protein TRAVEDRAFT_68801 [Trametes versicolor FP-101664 SS1]EIW65282.1 hypothetical protein TRAVEDRAFT_68801 [Trametes versicolor FP-101664 SS1]